MSELTTTLPIIIPSVGESVNTANIATWHKNDGDFVKKGDPLLTIETDKIATEIEAPNSGTLHITTPADTEIDIGTTVGTITPGDPPPTTTEATSPPPTEKTTPPPPTTTDNHPPTPPDTQVATTETKPAPTSSSPPPTPQTEKTSPPNTDDRTTRKRLSPIRRKIATALVNAQQNAAILTTFNEVDMTAIMQIRKGIQEEFTTKNGVKLGLMSFFVKASIAALRAIPSVNSRLAGDELITNHYYDIGVAISTPRGLIVPVLRDPDQKTFAQIEKDIITYAEKAQTGHLDLSDLTDGVFTITNGGIFGSLLSTPIINPPQSAILGMHTIQQRPIAIDGRIEIRPMMYLALSYDHRVIDGREAVTFLNHIKKSLENPAQLLIEA